MVEHDGFWWLRAGDPGSGWLKRIETNPNVRVTRNGKTQSYRAVPVREAEMRDRIHALMSEGYPAADRLIAMMRDGAGSVPVRLEPGQEGS